MPQLQSSVDPGSAAYAENRAQMLYAQPIEAQPVAQRHHIAVQRLVQFAALGRHAIEQQQLGGATALRPVGVDVAVAAAAIKFRQTLS